MINIAEIKLTADEIKAATEILESGALRQGPQCDNFEKEFAAKVGAKHAVTVSNGSASLHMYYMSEAPHSATSGASDAGFEVIVPSFTFIATASMAAFHGVKPLFCETDPETFLMDLDYAETLITPKTKFISPVHLFGNVVDIAKVEAFAKKHGLKILWDAAQSHGATYNGKDIGSFGHAVSYSFYPSKNMFVGEGGMVTTNDDQLAHNLRFLRTHGQTGKYYHEMLGLNYRMTDVEAAIGRKQLTRLDEMLRVRRRNADILNKVLAGVPGLGLQKVTPNSEHAWHQYCLTIDEAQFGMNRDQLSATLKEKGIVSGVHYPRGCHQQPVFEKMCGPQKALPITEKLCSQILAIPVHHGLSEEQAHTVANTIVECQKMKKAA